MRTFLLLVFLSLHQPVTKNQKPNLFVLIFVAVTIQIKKTGNLLFVLN
jgi:hypothetical protein